MVGTRDATGRPNERIHPGSGRGARAPSPLASCGTTRRGDRQGRRQLARVRAQRSSHVGGSPPPAAPWAGPAAARHRSARPGRRRGNPPLTPSSSRTRPLASRRYSSGSQGEKTAWRSGPTSARKQRVKFARQVRQQPVSQVEGEQPAGQVERGTAVGAREEPTTVEEWASRAPRPRPAAPPGRGPRSDGTPARGRPEGADRGFPAGEQPAALLRCRK